MSEDPKEIFLAYSTSRHRFYVVEVWGDAFIKWMDVSHWYVNMRKFVPSGRISIKTESMNVLLTRDAIIQKLIMGTDYERSDR